MLLIRFLLATAMICGFSVGTAFITVPAIIGLSGFLGGLLSIILIWLFGIASGLLYLEAFLAVPEANHLASLSKKLTGKFSSFSSSFIFIFYNYCILITCYIFLSELLYSTFNFQTKPLAIASIILITTFLLGSCIYLGRKPTLILISLFFLIFLVFFGFVISSDKFSLIPRIGTKTYFLYMPFAIGAIFNTSFYQTVLPTLVTFLKRNRTVLLYSLWTGFTFAMLILLMWLWITLRPEVYGHFLAASETKAASVAQGFHFLQQLPQLKGVFRFLALFAILVVLLSAALPLKEYFEDAAGNFAGKKRLLYFLLVVAIFIPSWLLSLLFKNHFMIFNSLAESLSEYLLAAVFPVQWVWAVRYKLALPCKPLLWGGKKMLIFLIFAAAFLLFILGTIPLYTFYW